MSTCHYPLGVARVKVSVCAQESGLLRRLTFRLRHIPLSSDVQADQPGPSVSAGVILHARFVTEWIGDSSYLAVGINLEGNNLVKRVSKGIEIPMRVIMESANVAVLIY